jgi:DNA-directed RNA polymerase subunit L
MAAKEHYFINLNFPDQDKWNKDKNKMHITLQNVHYSVANSLRRSIMSLVKTVGFRALPYEHSTINIEKNDTYLNNEIIKHRVSMIPVYVADDMELDDYEFIIDEVNNTNTIQMVDTSHFKIRRISTNTMLKESEVRRILPPNTLTGDFIPIVKLKPKYYTDLGMRQLNEVPSNITVPNTTPISLKLTAKLVRSNGMENGHFSPVCTCAYGNSIDQTVIKQKEDEYVSETNRKNAELGLSAIDEEVLRRRFQINEVYKYYKTDDYGEPNSFDFVIESIGQYTPIELIHRGFLELITEMDKFIEAVRTRNTELVDVKPSKTIGNGFEIIAKDMNDTLGNIIQCYLVNNCCLYDLGDKRTLESITYNKVHQLEDKVLFTVRCLKKGIDETISDVFLKGCEELVVHLKELDADLHNAYI